MARTTSQRVASVVLIALATVGCSPPALAGTLGQTEPGIELDGKKLRGKKLFEKETFGGNGRTCRTCHSKRYGHADPGRRAADRRTRQNPTTRLLIHDALDDDGVGTTRIQAHATIRYDHRLATLAHAGG